MLCECMLLLPVEAQDGMLWQGGHAVGLAGPLTQDNWSELIDAWGRC